MGSATDKVTIEEVATFDHLRSVWKSTIRRGLRSHTFREFYLAQDAIQFAAYEWGLDPFLRRLIDDVAAGTYSPDPADIMRGAKSTGLSRPLAFLSPRDALLYQSIIAKAEEDLRKDLRPWANADKDEKHVEVEVPDDDYVDWFELWLERQGIIKKICEEHEFVVESDISNFFGSIDIRVLQEYLLHQSSLHRDCIRLCMFIIRRVMRHPEYADSPSMGLPQETFGSSRLIAHGLLSEVDRHFDVEGEDGIYSRFMDDFVTGVDEGSVGEVFISRLQRRLERLGLYPNPSKTKVVPVSKFLVDSMVDENGYIDSVEHALKRFESPPPLRQLEEVDPDLIGELRDRALRFRSIPQGSWPKRYDRVRRRYYTLMRRLGLDEWLPFVCDDLAVHPDSCRTILEYTRAFPLTTDVVLQLFAFMRLSLNCYDDLPLLLIETLATAPNCAQVDLSADVVSGCREIAELVSDEANVPRSLSDWILAYLLPLAWKYGNRAAQEAFIADFVARRPPQCMSRLQAFPLQVSHGRRSAEIFHSDLAGLPWSSVLTIDFVRAVEQNDIKAVTGALNLLNPTVALLPNRYIVHNRPMLLSGLLARSDPNKLGLVCKGALDMLNSNPDRLKDSRLVAIMSDFVP